MLIDLSRRYVVISCQGDIQVSLVVPKVQIDLTTVIKDEALPVPMLGQNVLEELN